MEEQRFAGTLTPCYARFYPVPRSTKRGGARPGSFNMGVNGGRRALPLGPCPLRRPPIRGGARPGSFNMGANGGRIAYFDDDHSSGVMEKHRLSISLPSYMR